MFSECLWHVILLFVYEACDSIVVCVLFVFNLPLQITGVTPLSRVPLDIITYSNKKIILIWHTYVHVHVHTYLKLNIGHTEVTDRLEASEAFNNYFSNIGQQTSHNVPKVNKCFKSYMPRPTPHSFFLDPVSPSDVLNITNKLKTKISSGHDGISTKLLKTTINEIKEPLSIIINKSFETGSEPRKHEHN